jgi:ADP-heptose:LPS heptosyltransferase
MTLSLFLSVRLPTRLAILWRAYLAPRTSTDSLHRDGLSFLVVRLDQLGDVVLTTPLFRELKRSFPGSSCTLVVQEDFRQLLVTNPHIDEIIGLRPLRAAWLPAPMRSLLSVLLLHRSRLRGRHFDVAISPRWDVDDRLATLLCSLADARERVGYSEAASPAKLRINRGFDRAFSTCLSAGPVQHEVRRNLEIVKALGGTVENSKLEVRLTHRDREFASKLLASVPTSSEVVAVGIGGRSESRRWPLQNYAETLAQLEEKHRVQPVIICSHDEREEAGNLARLLPGKAIVMSGAPLRKVCAVLERCDLFIGNDSGSAHLAGAMNCRIIVISRHPAGGDPNHANSPVRFSPYCDRARVLQPAAGLDRCKVACVSSEPHCILAVPVGQVAAAAHEMLKGDASLQVCIPLNMALGHDDDLRRANDRVSAVALKKAGELSKGGRNSSASPP